MHDCTCALCVFECVLRAFFSLGSREQAERFSTMDSNNYEPYGALPPEEPGVLYYYIFSPEFFSPRDPEQEQAGNEAE